MERERREGRPVHNYALFSGVNQRHAAAVPPAGAAAVPPAGAAAVSPAGGGAVPPAAAELPPADPRAPVPDPEQLPVSLELVLSGDTLPVPETPEELVSTKEPWARREGFVAKGKTAGYSGGSATEYECPACLRLVKGGTTGAERHVSHQSNCSPTTDVGNKRKRDLLTSLTAETRKRQTTAIATAKACSVQHDYFQRASQGETAEVQNDGGLSVAVQGVLMYIMMSNTSLSEIDSQYLHHALHGVMKYAVNNVNWKAQFKMPSRRTVCKKQLPAMVAETKRRTEQSLASVRADPCVCNLVSFVCA
jgi:hypothetical protein